MIDCDFLHEKIKCVILLQCVRDSITHPQVGNDFFAISELTSSQANQKKNSLPRLLLSVMLHTALIRQFVIESN